MELIERADPQTLGLSEEQIRRLRDELQSTVVEIVSGSKAEAVALAKPKEKAVEVPKIKTKPKVVRI